jgi:hypothetical protein
MANATGPRQGSRSWLRVPSEFMIHDQLFFRYKTVFVIGNGVSTSTKGRIALSE